MKKVVWALLDDRMGSNGQINGIAQNLNPDKFKIVEKKIVYTKLSALPNFIRGRSLLGVAGESRGQFKEPWPDLVLSGSRRTAPVARWIKKRSGKKTKLIQLLYIGRTGVKDFERIFLPEHDRGKKEFANFRYVTGAPHRITDKSLKEAKDLWQGEFRHLPKPLTAVIVGGNIQKRDFGTNNAITLGREIKAFKRKTGGSILITDSKRTGTEKEKLILEEIDGIPSYQYLWGSSGVNPYMGFLACADNIIVTGDSVSMASESCGTGKPVFIFTGKEWLTKKHYRFVNSLYAGNFAAPLGLNAHFKPDGKLNATFDIVKEIEELI